MPKTSSRTLLEALPQKLLGCHVHSNAEEATVAILWTDPRSEWKSLIPQLRQQLPELLCLGDDAPEHQQGPAGATRLEGVPLDPGAADRADVPRQP